MPPKYSVIIPVYNRPQEVEELLESLTHQTVKNFDVLIIEDGSTIRCEAVTDRYRDKLSIQYFYKPNTGPGPTRNFGYARAAGSYLVVFDSDCIIPPGYFEAVDRSLQENQWDAWGIRGGKKRVGWFQPRSFNMGISRKVYEATQGFKFDRFAEDIEFSIRMKKAGFHVGLIPEAYVYHKRRTNFSQFYNQVFNFGRGRALVGKVHPEEIKITHWFPSIFVLGTGLMLLLPFIDITLFAIAFGGWLFYLAAIFLHSLVENKNLLVAILSVPAALLQLGGYGAGFLKERFKTTP
jgi:glycosyltransferase involved in cell wall biosynthesis